MLQSLESIIQESEGITASLPNVSMLKEAARKAKEWISKVEVLQVSLLPGTCCNKEVMLHSKRLCCVTLDSVS